MELIVSNDETVGLIGANKLPPTHLLPTERIEY